MNSRVLITTSERNEITYLKESYASTPFKIADVREDKNQACLDIMLMSSSPGMLSSDDYKIEIDISENCSLSLKTQSYQRLFSMKNEAKMNMRIRLSENAFFEFIPHPTVPHKDAHVSILNDIQMSSGSSVIWSDIITCGRKLNKEQFVYNHFENRTTFTFGEEIVVNELTLFRPQQKSPTGFGQLESFSHVASVYFLGECLNAKKVKRRIDELMVDKRELCVASSCAPFNGVVVKMLADKAEYLYAEIVEMCRIIKKEFFIL